jgi:hypothetical protein
MPDGENRETRPINFRAKARNDFDSAFMKGSWHEVLSWFLQRKNTLIPFDQVRKVLPVKGQHWIGLRQVPLSQIVGSVGRYQDFDAAFAPRQTRTMGRWMSVDVAHLQEIYLPPVELYKIGEVYFVKDGNHRVSVAHTKNQVFIDAEVIEIDVDVPVTAEINLEKLILDLEKAAFNERTQIDKIRPEAQLELTLPGQYEKLLEHIDVHRWYLGEQRQGEVPYEEALASWYDTVYMPLVEIIRQKGILKDFPGRTETDLYFWIIEHYWYLTQSAQEDISLEEAAEDYREEFSQRPVKKVVNILKKAARAMTGGIEPENNSNEPGSTSDALAQGEVKK